MTEKKSNFLRNSVVIVLIFFLGCASMYGLIHFFPNIIGITETKVNKNVSITDTGIADAVEKVYDAVVTVNTYVDGGPFQSGTGFVYKVEGNLAYILTNNHVINKATEVNVTFTDGNVVETKIVGADVYSDVAILSVPKDDILAVAELGKSEDLRIGDTVFAIGTPLDSAYSWTVTRGIVSGKNRLVEAELDDGTSMVVRTVQTDTAINSGNSGGALANANGEVVGITAIKIASASIEGIGFALPIENALKIASQLEKNQEVERPYLGVYMADVASAYREYYQVISRAGVTSGVLVTDVEERSSAALAGIKKNDIIIEVDEHEISSIAYLRYYLYEHEVGDEMYVTVKRGDSTEHIRVRLTAK